jgi:hypothetical protein
LKLERAAHHIEEFKLVIAAYTARPIAFPEFDKSGGVPTLKGWKAWPVPDVLSTILGDVVHNLRAALDLMASELCRRNGQSDKDAYFPFAEREADLNKMVKRKNFHLAGEAAVRLLHEYAPYTGGNLELRALHDLDIQDKHRTLIFTPGEIARLRVTWSVGGDGSFEPQSEIGPFTLFMPKDSALAGREAVKTLEDLMELTTSIVEAFKILPVPAR